MHGTATAMREIFSNLPPLLSTSNYSLNKTTSDQRVGQTLNLWKKRKAKSHQKSLLKSAICVEEVPLSVATALREEYTTLVPWILDPNKGVEPPIRRLLATLIDSGADELGPAKNVIAQLLESSVAHDLPYLREKGHKN